MKPQDHQLDRFVVAQELDYALALSELVAGRKRTHWIWYVLPQLRSLGRSQMARDYGIENREEAKAYVAHPLLGPRLIACVNAILSHSDCSAVQILGDIDALKFRSCLTLFSVVAPEEKAFESALNVFFQGLPDDQTLRLLSASEK